MSEQFFERLSKGPLLCDGAMGTMLYARAPESILHGRCFDELVLTDAALVEKIHCDYIEAGARIIETNTFGANSAKLADYGLGDQVTTINRRAAQLAREAREVAGEQVFIAGAVGPSGLLNLGAAAVSETAPSLLALRSLFREQITALIEGGVDLIILETFSNLEELRQAVLAAREVGSGLPSHRANDLQRRRRIYVRVNTVGSGAGTGQDGRGRDRNQLQHRTGRHTGCYARDDHESRLTAAGARCRSRRDFCRRRNEADLVLGAA